MRRNVGAVLVKDQQILSTGYNGAPKGIIHCEDAGCLREKLGIPSGERHEICRGSHAGARNILGGFNRLLVPKDLTDNSGCSVCTNSLAGKIAESLLCINSDRFSSNPIFIFYGRLMND